jgi:hypothetical protein
MCCETSLPGVHETNGPLDIVPEQVFGAAVIEIHTPRAQFDAMAQNEL